MFWCCRLPPNKQTKTCQRNGRWMSMKNTGDGKTQFQKEIENEAATWFL